MLGLGDVGGDIMLIQMHTSIGVNRKERWELVSFCVGFIKLTLIRLLLCPRRVLT